MQQINILGISIANIKLAQALQLAEKAITANNNLHIVTVNPEFISISRQNAKFLKVLQKADMAVADGVGLQFAAFLKGEKFVERIPGRILSEKLCEKAAKEGWKVFLLGAKEGVASKASKELKVKYPSIKIETSSLNPTQEDTKKAIEKINNFKPQILLVAYGAPKQDLWIAENKGKLKVNIMVGVGGTFNYWAGISKIPPAIISKIGFEWLYRLMLEPRRFKRQLILPTFVWLSIKEKFSPTSSFSKAD